MEDRLGEQMDAILSVIRKSLSAPSASSTVDMEPSEYPVASADDVEEVYTEEQNWEETYDANEMIFDDAGEGVGVEGDLDMEEE